MPEQSPTIDCGHCGTPVKRSVRTCPACHAQRGVGRIASGRVIGPEKIPKLRRLLALSLVRIAVFWATGVWEGAVVCGAVALGLVFQSGSVIFSRGREYWFR